MRKKKFDGVKCRVVCKSFAWYLLIAIVFAAIYGIEGCSSESAFRVQDELLYSINDPDSVELPALLEQRKRLVDDAMVLSEAHRAFYRIGGSATMTLANPVLRLISLSTVDKGVKFRIILNWKYNALSLQRVDYRGQRRVDYSSLIIDRNNYLERGKWGQVSEMSRRNRFGDTLNIPWLEDRLVGSLLERYKGLIAETDKQASRIHVLESKVWDDIGLVEYFYFSVTSMVGGGYGDILPNSTWVRLTVVFQFLITVLYTLFMLPRLYGD